MPHVLALDEGTTSARAIVFDEGGAVRAVAQREFRQIYPRPGWVEHDAREIWAAQIGVANEALHSASLQPRDLVSIGITNQRETVVVWDRATGEPIYNAIVWQDRRTAAHCDRLEADGCNSLIQSRTGLLIDPYFSATKIAWILDNIPNARQRAEAGELAFGTMDSWLVWNLTGGQRHLTDASNASRTLLFNIHTGNWDDELLRLFDIPANMLPEVRSSSEVYGEVVAKLLGADRIPIASICGDQQAALFGHLCCSTGQTKVTYGTGCFMLQCTGPVAVKSKHRLLSTVAWTRKSEMTYATEGSVFTGGAIVQWLRDGLGIIDSSDAIDALAASVPDCGGVCLVPALTGLGAPHWDPRARGILAGLSRGTTKGHIARAALEGIAHQVADLLEAMRADTGLPFPEIHVDGGATRSNVLMQFQADLLGVPLVLPNVTETTALGAAYLAGLAVGMWHGLDQLQAHQTIDRVFEPNLSADEVAAHRNRWRRALDRARNWAAEEPS
jgi:glycerol kinase